MCGVLPNGAATVEVMVDGVGEAPVQQAEGAFLVAVPSDRALTLTFRDAIGRVVKTDRIGAVANL